MNDNLKNDCEPANGRKNKSFWLALIFAWVIPGAGHYYIGKRDKAVMLFFAISSLLLLGLILSDFRDYRVSENPFYYIGRVGCGMALVVLSVFTKLVPSHPTMLKFFEIGAMYISVAGILNLLTMTNIIDFFVNPSTKLCSNSCCNKEGQTSE